MPFTPLHFGPGAAINALAPKHISFLSFCAANVLIDVEPLYFMLNAQYPIHRFLHTYLGASTIIIATLALFVLARKLSRWLPNWFAWQSLSPAAVTFGAAAVAIPTSCSIASCTPTSARSHRLAMPTRSSVLSPSTHYTACVSWPG